MTQTMGQDPSSCNVVTSNKPSAPGTWLIQQPGKGTMISGHDHEGRDHCYKKGGPNPQPRVARETGGAGVPFVILQAASLQ